MKKSLRGSLTIEAAVIVPLILLVFSVLIHILFYYHDKNVIICTAYETVVYGSCEEQKTDLELEDYYQSRIKGKLLLFTYTIGEVEQEDDTVKITCTAVGKQTSLRIERMSVRTDPEGYIRNIRKIEKLGEKVGGEN